MDKIKDAKFWRDFYREAFCKKDSELEIDDMEILAEVQDYT